MNDVVMPSQRERDPIVKVAFKPISWLKKIDFVKRLVLDNNVLISLLGEEESGKTTFAHLLRSVPSSQIHPYFFMANPRFNRNNILKDIASLLKLEEDSSLETVVEFCKHQKSHHLLMIDDAHYLSVDFIEELLAELKKQGNKAYFHVMLISDFSLVPALNAFAQDTYKDMIHSIEVPPLTESETKTYILQHMPFLMGPGKKINDERFKQFFQITQGHVVEINREMGKFFYDAASHPIHKKRTMFYSLGIVAIFGLITFASILVWNFAHNFLMNAPQDLAIPLPPNPVGSSPTASLDQVQKFDSQIPKYTLSATRQSVTTLIRMSDLVDQDLESSVEPLAVMDKVIVAPKVIEKKSTVASVKAQKVMGNIAKDKPQPTKNINTVTSKILDSPALLKNKNSYTVQLLASHSKTKLNQFVHQHHLDQKTKIIRTVRKGNDWYLLLLGEYKAHQGAIQAIHNLPKEIVEFKPWIRRISELNPRENA